MGLGETRKLVLWFVGCLVLVIVAISAYFGWENYDRFQCQKRAIASIRRGELSNYWNVPLGATQNDVIYLKGEPTSKNEEDVHDGKVEWTYKAAGYEVSTTFFRVKTRGSLAWLATLMLFTSAMMWSEYASEQVKRSCAKSLAPKP